MDKENYVVCQKTKKDGKTVYVPISPLFDGINYFIKTKGAQINIKVITDSSQIKIIPEERVAKMNIISYFKNWMTERKKKVSNKIKKIKK